MVGSNIPESAECDNCGNFHVYSYLCPYNLHGEPDPFKTKCAVCETDIPSGAPRESDQYGNLYCDAECKAEGLSILIARLEHKGIPQQ